MAASDLQKFLSLTSHLGEDQKAPTVPLRTERPAGYGEDVSAGLTAGAASAKQSLYRGLQLAGADTGKNADYQAIVAEEASRNIAAPQQLSDIHGIGDAFGYAKQGLAKSAAQMGTGLVIGAGATLATGNPAAGMAAAAASQFPFGVGESVQAQMDQGATIDQVKGGAAVLGGLGYAAAGALSPELGLLKAALGGTGKGIVRGALGEIPVAMSKEGTEEALQTIVSDVAQRGAVDQNYDMLGADARGRVGEAFGGGALIGAPVGAVVGGYAGRAKPTLPTPSNEPAPTPTATPPNAPKDMLTGQQGDLFGAPALHSRLPVAAPEEVQAPAFNPNQGALLLQDVGPNQAERTAAALAPFQREAGVPLQALVDQQTGVSAPPSNISAPGMAKRLNEEVINPGTGESMGTLGDIYAQVAAERSPLQMDMPPKPAGLMGPHLTEARGQLRQYMTQNKIKGKSQLGKAMISVINGTQTVDDLKAWLVNEGETIDASVYPKFDAVYRELSGGETIDEALTKRAEAPVQETPNAATSEPAAPQPEPVASVAAPAPVGAVQPAGGEVAPSNAPKRRRVRANAQAAGQPDAEAVRAVPAAAEQQPALTPEPAVSAVEQPAQPVKPRAKPVGYEGSTSAAMTPYDRQVVERVRNEAQAEQTPGTIKVSKQSLRKISADLRKVDKAANAPTKAELNPDEDELTNALNAPDLESADMFDEDADADGLPFRWEDLNEDERSYYADAGRSADAFNHVVKTYMTRQRLKKLAAAFAKSAQETAGGVSLQQVADAYGEASMSDDAFMRLRDTLGRRVEANSADGLTWAKTLLKDTTFGPYKQLLRALLASSRDILADYRVEFDAPVDENGNRVPGKIEHAQQRILIDDRFPTEQAVIHELFHAAVDGRTMANDAMRAELEAIMAEVKAAVGVEHNAFESPREFLNYFFTSPALRDLVAKAAPGKMDTWFAKLMRGVKAVLRAFNLVIEASEFPATAFDKRMTKVLNGLLKEPPVGYGGVSYMRNPAATAEGGAMTELARLAETYLGRDLTTRYTVLKRKLKRNGLGILTNQQMGDIFGTHMGKLGEVLGLMNRQEQFKNSIIKSSDPLFRHIRQYLAGDKETGDKLSNLAYDSTVSRIWPDRPLEQQEWLYRSSTDAEGKVTREVPDEVKAEYERAAAEYEALPDEAKQLFAGLFKHAQDMRNLIISEMIDLQVKTVGKNLDEVLNEPELSQVRALIERQIAAEYDSKDYRAVRAEILALYKTLPDAAAAVVRTYADGVGDAKSLGAIKGPYLPLMRRGDFVYVYKSDALKAKEKELQDLNDRLRVAAKADTSGAEIRRLTEALKDAETAAKKARQKLTARPSSAALSKALLEANQAVQAAREELKNAKSASRETEYAELNRERNAARKELQALEKDAEQFAVVFSDSELELEKLVQEKGGVYLPRAFIANEGGKYQEFANRLSAEATKNMSPEDAAVVQSMATELYLQLAPDSSYLKRQMKRRDISGFSRDLQDNFMEFTRSVASRVSRVKYAGQIADAMSEMAADREGDPIVKADVSNELKRRFSMSLRQQPTPIQDFLTKLGAFFYLGATPAFPILNATQGALVTYPMLGAKFGFKKAGQAMLQAVADMKDIYQPKNLFGKGALSYEVDPQQVEQLTDGEKKMLKQLEELGRLNFSQVVEMAESGTNPKWDMIQRMAWHLPHHTEVMNRFYSALAAYRLAKDAGQSQEEATKTAVDIVTASHGDYNPDNKPRYFRQIYKPLTLFKSYAQMMAFATLRSAYLATRGETPAVRAEARRMIAGFAVMHQLFAGAVGLPGMGLLGAVLNLFKDDDDEPWDYKTEMRAFLKDTLGEELGNVAYGGVFRLTPFDIGSRVGAADVLTMGIRFQDDPNKRGKDEAAAQVMNLAGPIGSIAGNFAGGYDKASQGDMAAGLASMLPKAAGDVFTAVNQMKNGEDNKRGVNLQEFNGLEIAGQLLGLSPTSKAEASEIRQSRYKYKGEIESRRSGLILQRTKAAMQNDKEALADLDDEIDAFNEAMPARKITGATLRQSLRRLRAQQATVQDGVVMEEDYLPAQ